MELYFWEKCQKGGGRRPCQQIWITFNGFILLNSIKSYLFLSKISKGKGGLGGAENIGDIFWTFDPFRIFKKCWKKELCSRD